MGGNIYHEKSETFCSFQYRFLAHVKGSLLHATISYLESLSLSDISKEALIKEGIVSADDIKDPSEQVFIVNWRACINSAISLLNLWKQEVRDDSPLNMDVFDLHITTGLRILLNAHLFLVN